MQVPSGTRDGFTILEVVVAIGVIAVVATGIAQLASLAVDGNLAARDRTSAAILAAQKLEQLRSLRWTYRDDGGTRVRLSDIRTNLAVDPASSTGTGLRPTTVRSLEDSTPGFVDYLDAFGAWVGTGSSPSPGTVFVRRWAITRLPDDPVDTLVLQVRVTTLRRESRVDGGAPPGSLPDEAWLITVLTRKAT